MITSIGGIGSGTNSGGIGSGTGSVVDNFSITLNISKTLLTYSVFLGASSGTSSTGCWIGSNGWFNINSGSISYSTTGLIVGGAWTGFSFDLFRL